MGNSASSGNILGYASGTQPGLVSTTAQTFAGKKTLDGGALIKGDTSGSAIASGYVGEVLGSTLRSGTGGFYYSTALSGGGTWAVGTRYTVITQSLNKGTYLACFNGTCTGNWSSANSVDLGLAIGGTLVTPNFYYTNPAITNGSAEINAVIPVVISSDSTVVTFNYRITGVGTTYTISVFGDASFVRIA